MKERFAELVVEVSTLEEVKDKVLIVLAKEKKENPNTRIGYVAGVITSDGQDKLLSNLETLKKYTQKLREINDYPIFSSTDIFSEEVAKNIEIERYSQKDWLKFWQDIVGSGYVTDIFMTPRWKESRGARDEYDTANEHKLNIHLVEEEFLSR